MAGSDDRPVSEWTLLERLNNLEAWVHQTGATARDIEFLTQEAANEIERLRPTPEPVPERELTRSDRMRLASDGPE